MIRKCSKNASLFLCLIILFFSIPFYAQEAAEESEPELEIAWIEGPAKAQMESVAEIDVPEGFLFANAEDTRKLMQYYGNQLTEMEVGYLAPQDNSWFIVFEFNETGYVKDDEKESIDKDKLLKSIQKGTSEGNKWREENNMPPLEVVGWHIPPYYDSATHNLEWATELESDGKRIFNHNIRYLGRKGVMEMTIVANPENFDAALATSKQLLAKYSFSSGNKYEEFVKGDKIAKYGLTALIAGGTVAAAAKSGLLAKFWKVIVAAFVGLGVAIKSFFAKIFGRKAAAPVQPSENNDGETK